MLIKDIDKYIRPLILSVCIVLTVSCARGIENSESSNTERNSNTGYSKPGFEPIIPNENIQVPISPIVSLDSTPSPKTTSETEMEKYELNIFSKIDKEYNTLSIDDLLLLINDKEVGPDLVNKYLKSESEKGHEVKLKVHGVKISLSQFNLNQATLISENGQEITAIFDSNEVGPIGERAKFFFSKVTVVDAANSQSGMTTYKVIDNNGNIVSESNEPSVFEAPNPIIFEFELVNGNIQIVKHFTGMPSVK